MVSWRAVATTDDAARALLDEYFRERALTFPPQQGRYHTALPHPEDFVPPAGLFLIASVESGAADRELQDIGCGGIRALPASGDGRFELKHLYLRPHARGHGYGRALLTELEARARSFGARELVLDTNVSQAAAAHLYAASGYRQIAPYNQNPNATTWFAKTL